MTPRGSATTPMGRADVSARAAQARSFLEAARLTTEFADELGETASANVAASNAVLAGIAAADAICGMALGERSSSGNHSDAVALLKRAHGGAAASNQLKALIAIKSTAAYEPRMVTPTKAAEALRNAERLVMLMDEILR